MHADRRGRAEPDQSTGVVLSYELLSGHGGTRTSQDVGGRWREPGLEKRKASRPRRGR